MTKRKKESEGTLPLFPEEAAAAPGAATPEYVEKNRDRIQAWSRRGVYLGTSSWKYPGWQGIVYNRRYPSKRAFERRSRVLQMEGSHARRSLFRCAHRPRRPRCRSPMVRRGAEEMMRG